MPPSDAYLEGCEAALMKLGFIARTLGTAAAGALAGNLLAPEDRKGIGTFAGAAGGALGGLAGHHLGPALLGEAKALQRPLSELDLTSPQRLLGSGGPRARPPLSNEALRSMGMGLGAASGFGAGQLLVNKKHPDHTEDPYYYAHHGVR